MAGTSGRHRWQAHERPGNRLVRKRNSILYRAVGRGHGTPKSTLQSSKDNSPGGLSCQVIHQWPAARLQYPSCPGTAPCAQPSCNTYTHQHADTFHCQHSTSRQGESGLGVRPRGTHHTPPLPGMYQQPHQPVVHCCCLAAARTHQPDSPS